jgi:hypothetical protein
MWIISTVLVSISVGYKWLYYWHVCVYSSGTQISIIILKIGSENAPISRVLKYRCLVQVL